VARWFGRDKPGYTDSVGTGGTMPLVGHLRELRQRLVKGVLAILVGTICAWFFYDHLLDFLIKPYRTGISDLLRERGIDARIVISGVGGAFSFQLKISLLTGILVSSPIWIWQIWAFVLPALHKNERRWSFLLTATGVPLFIGGVALGYVVMPKAIEVLIGFIPEGFESFLTAGDYLNFMLRTLLVFGIAAEIPLVVVMLNRLGIVSFKQLSAARPWTIIGIFVFAAVATPSTDPLTMLFLASPMTVLYFVSENIARLTDRKRKRVADAGIGDDELSPIEDDGDAGDTKLSDL